MDASFPGGCGIFQDGCQDSSDSGGDRRVQGASDITFTHGPELKPWESLWDVLEKLCSVVHSGSVPHQSYRLCSQILAGLVSFLAGQRIAKSFASDDQ